MAKVSGPLFSLDARGQVGKAIVFSFWKGVNYVRQHVVPNNPQSSLQTAIRDLVTDASVAWKLGSTIGGIDIDAAYKLDFNTAAAGQAYSGFDLYMKDTIALNGGSAYDGSLAIPAGA
jgi:hypothetical protein